MSTFSSVWDALEDDPAKREGLKLCSHLMIIICSIVEERGWTQTESAENLGLTEDRMIELLKGKFNSFSIEQLFACFYRLGFRFKPKYENHQLIMSVQVINETAYLMESSEKGRRLDETMNQIESGDVINRGLADLIDKCDLSGDSPKELEEREQAKPVGKEEL